MSPTYLYWQHCNKRQNPLQNHIFCTSERFNVCETPSISVLFVIYGVHVDHIIYRKLVWGVLIGAHGRVIALSYSSSQSWNPTPLIPKPAINLRFEEFLKSYDQNKFSGLRTDAFEARSLIRFLHRNSIESDWHVTYFYRMHSGE